MSAPHELPDAAAFQIAFTKMAADLSQDEESFDFVHKGRKQRLRIHDYADIFQIPGLYEALVYDKLECNSPPRLAELLASVLADWTDALPDLRVLDLGAGNGIMAEQLRRVGVGYVVGLDLLPEAAAAARRDRPDVYEDYIVADLTELSEATAQRLTDARLDCLVTAAALGFGDIPPEAFARAFNLIASEGWIAMTIKEDFLDPNGDDSGFAQLLRSLIESGIIEIQAHQRYCHRLSIDGEQLFYLAVVARKTADIPAANAVKTATNGTVEAAAADAASVLLGGSL